MKSLNSQSILPMLLSLLLALAVTLPARAQTAADQAGFTAAELDQMLAPVALYPDTVLSHVLIASTYPLEVVQADRWVRDNPGLEAEAAVAAVEDQDWDPSVKALVAFPQILERMSDDLAWTQRLGDAFLDDEAGVMDAIQNLRNKAYASGSLDRLEHVRVQREKEVIIIEPAVERVVYVPVYDTRVVYGHWWWNDHPPIYWHYPSHYTFVHGFYWGPRIYVGPSFFFSSFHWHKRHVVYVDHRRYQHRPHFYTGRSIVNYRGASHWRHNPSHRRGVAYHNERVRQHYGSNRQSYSTSHLQRGTQPNWRRDQQQANTNQRRDRDQQIDRRTDAQRGNVQRESERVRERLSNNQSGASPQPERTNGATQRPTFGNNQTVNRDRDNRDQDNARPANRGNSTLPSQNDPRPNVRRDAPEQRSPSLGSDSDARARPQLQSSPRPTESRQGLGNQRQQPVTTPDNTSARAQRIESAGSQPQIGRPSTNQSARPVRTESSRPTRTESARPSRTGNERPSR